MQRSDSMRNIEEKLFHSCRDVCLKIFNQEDILRYILSSNMIYNRHDLDDKYAGLFRRVGTQNNDEVCLSLHKNNPYYVPDCRVEESSFDSFVLYYVSLILDPTILKRGNFDLAGMPHEIRVKGSIDLKDSLEGVSLPITIVEELDKIKKILAKDDIALLKYYRDKVKFLSRNINEYMYTENARYERILGILKEVHKDIPVVEPITGKEIPRLFKEDFEEARDIRDEVYKKLFKKM